MRAIILYAPALLAAACGAPLPVESPSIEYCDTTELDIAYATALVEECGGKSPEACPAAEVLGDQYEAAVYQMELKCLQK